MPIHNTSSQHFHHLCPCGDALLGEPFNVDSLLYVLSDLEIETVGVEKINDLFIVNLEVGGPYQEFKTIELTLGKLFLLFDSLENVLKSPRHDSRRLVPILKSSNV